MATQLSQQSKKALQEMLAVTSLDAVTPHLVQRVQAAAREVLGSRPDRVIKRGGPNADDR